ncbi:STM4504/CBY_0614 family protein [Agrobacterium pusense]|uniref:STM4504/CBY_0614 family protein n=1 Tax=Agrobacterium pusense TaxID=648995 RepID=UPI00345E3292
MALFELYSKRKAKAEGSVSDVYQYDQIPNKLRVQITQIFEENIGNANLKRDYRNRPQEMYESIVKLLRREYGVHKLNNHFIPYNDTYMEELFGHILECEEVDQVLDAIEVGCVVIDGLVRSSEYKNDHRFDENCDSALSEINDRFKENGVGYEYTGNRIVRVDSELIHSEVVKPALSFLNGSMYEGPRQEFLGAHKHYRAGEHKQAIVDCLKAFESTMKAICEKRGWTYDKGKATAKDLIAVCFNEGLVPSYWQNNLANLRALLESGVPTGRNKNAGHGQGATPVTVDDSVSEYIMHMTASTILFLARAEKELP